MWDGTAIYAFSTYSGICLPFSSPSQLTDPTSHESVSPETGETWNMK